MERYESLGPVGEGSYGTVQKCRHRDSGRLVAIKKFVDSDNDKTVKKIALREIKLLRKLRHDNLVNLLEAWKRRRRWYLVFEFVERTLLDDLEQNPSGLDLNTSRQYLYQILRAAAFCHQQNVIHRDIKPENILISQGGVVKLCDFGFARIVASPAEGGVYTDYVATRWYRAPELLVGDTEYSKPVDVWAVGCLSVETLTGRPLFPGDSDLDQIHHIVGCFGKLTAHQRELFYRNPVFSGVRLPECSGRVRLEQRFPTIAPTALDLARSCLQMDPERRAQCSELLEHPLFTQDSFHIRVLDELNAKIQKDHRENSTLPKIVKTPRREKDERDEKNRRGKDEKRPKAAGEEKARKGEEKTEKATGKQPSKLSKSIRNTSDPLTSTKQPKTSGAKITDNAAKTTAATISKLGKATGVELRKEPKISRPTKTVTDPKEDYAAAAKPKYGNVSPELRRDSLKTTKDTRDRDSSGLRSSRSDNIALSTTESNKVAKSPKTSTTYSTDTHSTVKTHKISTAGYPEGAPTVVTSKTSDGDRAEESSTLKASQPSRDDRIEVATPTIPSVAKPRKKTTTSDHRTDRSTADATQRRTSKSLAHLKLWPKNAQKRHVFVHRPFKGS